MKAMSKSELAMKAGVSVNTLMNCCKPYSRQLARMGMQHHAKVLPLFALQSYEKTREM